MSDLDKLFEEIVQEKLLLFERRWIAFNLSHEHWTEQKKYKEFLTELREERNKMTKSNWERGGDPYLPASFSEYKNALFSHFHSRHTDYVTDPVHHFMHEVYPEIKKNFRIKFMVVTDLDSEITQHQLSEFFNCTEKETIEQLALYEAVLKFINNLEVEEHDILFRQRYPGRLESVKQNEISELPFPDDVHQLIKNGDDLKAVERLENHLNESGLLDKFEGEIIPIQANLTTADRDYCQGVMTWGEKNIQLQKARKLILALVKRVQER